MSDEEQWVPVLPKPPWEARDLRERQWMQAWVCARLDERLYQQFSQDLASFSRLVADPEACRAYFNKWTADRAFEAFARGDPQRLRKHADQMDPRFRRAINLPPGKHRRRDVADDTRARLRCARAELPLVRAIWREYYGQTYRKKGQLRAAEIVAARWHLTEEEVIKGRLSAARQELAQQFSPPKERVARG